MLAQEAYVKNVMRHVLIASMGDLVPIVCHSVVKYQQDIFLIEAVALWAMLTLFNSKILVLKILYLQLETGDLPRAYGFL